MCPKSETPKRSFPLVLKSIGWGRQNESKANIIQHFYFLPAHFTKLKLGLLVPSERFDLGTRGIVQVVSLCFILSAIVCLFFWVNFRSVSTALSRCHSCWMLLRAFARNRSGFPDISSSLSATGCEGNLLSFISAFWCFLSRVNCYHWPHDLCYHHHHQRHHHHHHHHGLRSRAPSLPSSHRVNSFGANGLH